MALGSPLSLLASFFRLEKRLIILDKFKAQFIVFLLIDFQHAKLTNHYIVLKILALGYSYNILKISRFQCQNFYKRYSCKKERV